MHLPSVILSVLICSGAAVTGAENVPTVPPTATAATAPATLTADQAEALVQSGQLAMKDSDAKPERIVDAAIAFGAALPYFQAQGDTDRISELQADIFWCKKRMDLDEVKAYVAQKHGDVANAAALATAERVAAAVIPQSEGEAYFARAQTYAERHPQNDLEVAMRYFEVAERFQGSEVSLKAQKLSLEAQTRYLRTQSAATAHSQAHDQAFKAPTRGEAAPPAADALKSATAMVRESYKSEYAQTRSRAHRGLAVKLLGQAEQTGDNADLRYALYVEAREQAVAAKDVPLTLAAINALDRAYKDVDAVALAKVALPRCGGSGAAAVLKQLAAPDDAEAASAAGRYLGVECGAWDQALPLLAKGSDQDLAKAAQLEVAGPATASEMSQVADRWYDLGKPATAKLREGLWMHAQHWYGEATKATPALQGLTAKIVAKRQEELAAVLPLPADFDWSTLTAGQWDRLRAPVVVVPANQPRTPTTFVVSAERPLRVVPHPTDVWIFRIQQGRIEVNHAGAIDGQHPRFAGLGCYIENGARGDVGAKVPTGVISTPGHLAFGPELPAQAVATAVGRRGGGLGAAILSTGSGEIRVKVVAVEDE
ncbi:MAG: hypothetical protein H0X38_10990 [Planctomycetes bacterium]|nr:hypothetical protein [Planctomycetota bacterium]